MSPYRRILSRLLPLSWQRRRIARAVEVILSNIELFAHVEVRMLAGRGVLMQLHATVQLSAEAQEQTRRYIARKLNAFMGISLAADEIYVVSMPPKPPQYEGLPAVDSNQLARMILMAPPWPGQMPMDQLSERRRARAGTEMEGQGRLRTTAAVAAAGTPAADVPADFSSERTVPISLEAIEAVRRADATKRERAPDFDLPDDPRWDAARNVEVAEFSMSQVGVGTFELSEPAPASRGALPPMA